MAMIYFSVSPFAFSALLLRNVCVPTNVYFQSVCQTFSSLWPQKISFQDSFRDVFHSIFSKPSGVFQLFHGALSSPLLETDVRRPFQTFCSLFLLNAYIQTNHHHGDSIHDLDHQNGTTERLPLQRAIQPTASEEHKECESQRHLQRILGLLTATPSACYWDPKYTQCKPFLMFDSEPNTLTTLGAHTMKNEMCEKENT